jgi:membrane-bound metal-dependent hydrolase YbcI (DUF457 family)
MAAITGRAPAKAQADIQTPEGRVAIGTLLTGLSVIVAFFAAALWFFSPLHLSLELFIVGITAGIILGAAFTLAGVRPLWPLSR